MENVPLPEKLRPKKLTEFVGQVHLVGKNGVISKLLSNKVTNNYFPSLIFWGPPGSGKTTLARIIASELKREFYEFSAVNTSSKDVQKIISQTNPLFTSPVVFIDEIHRFNKAQQDKLLPYVEKGQIILIGATTENPSFEVIGPLLSRCRVVTLNQLTEKDLGDILNRGLKEVKALPAGSPRVEAGRQVKINSKAKSFLIESSNGDARVLLNVLEIASNLSKQKESGKVKGVKLYHPKGDISSHLTIFDIEQALQRRQLTFDKQGEEFYNVISAFIKSMRAIMWMQLSITSLEWLRQAKTHFTLQGAWLSLRLKILEWLNQLP